MSFNESLSDPADMGLPEQLPPAETLLPDTALAGLGVEVDRNMSWGGALTKDRSQIVAQVSSDLGVVSCTEIIARSSDVKVSR